MKLYFKPFVATGIFLLLLCILPQLAMSQGPGDPLCDPDVYCPIDGGVSLLIAAGVAIGVKKLRDERKKKIMNLP